MKLYLERKDGKILIKQRVRKKIPGRRDPHSIMRTMKIVDDTPENLTDVKRWANAVGHDLEKI